MLLFNTIVHIDKIYDIVLEIFACSVWLELQLLTEVMILQPFTDVSFVLNMHA